MQEIMKDGSEGKAFVENTIEELLPHIKKSLEDPKVKYVKVFRAKIEDCITSKEKDGFSLEEQKLSPLDELIEKCEEGDKKNKEEMKDSFPPKKKNHYLRMPRKK